MVVMVVSPTYILLLQVVEALTLDNVTYGKKEGVREKKTKARDKGRAKWRGLASERQR